MKIIHPIMKWNCVEDGGGGNPRQYPQTGVEFTAPNGWHFSFLTRAKMGKLLNKCVPYGYTVKDGEMLLHPEEAPIRREAFELFLQHRRKYSVAQMLNAKGYRTRKGRQWRELQIRDMLIDSSAKGIIFLIAPAELARGKLSPSRNQNGAAMRANRLFPKQCGMR